MYFKKQISFILAVFLLVSNVGLAIDVHYCGGEVASVTPIYFKNHEALLALEEDCCAPEALDSIEKKESCCKDKVIQFEKKQDNVLVKSITFQTDFIFLLDNWGSIAFTEFPKFEDNRKIDYCCDAHAPPLFQLYHQYIFYA